MAKSLYIVGSGGVGREILATLVKYYSQEYKVEGFIDDGKPIGEVIQGVQVVGGLAWLKTDSEQKAVLIAIGNPKTRKKIINDLRSVNLDFPTIIHPSVILDNDETCTIGKGCYLGALSCITTNVTIGDFCFINTHCSLQHDTVLGDNVTLMPGVRITGGATIGTGTYISGNVLIADKIEVEKDSFL